MLAAKAQAHEIPFKEMEKLVFSFTSLKEYVTPQQLADLVVFVASPHGRLISGQALSVCGDTNMLDEAGIRFTATARLLRAGYLKTSLAAAASM